MSKKSRAISIPEIYSVAHNRASARKQYKGLDKKTGAKMIEQYFQIVAETIIKGEYFHVPGIGPFEIVKTPSGLKNNLVVTEKKEYIGSLEKYGYRLICNSKTMDHFSTRIKMTPKMKMILNNYIKSHPEIKFRIVKNEHKKEGIY